VLAKMNAACCRVVFCMASRESSILYGGKHVGAERVASELTRS
jgi:hypothetical protein